MVQALQLGLEALGLLAFPWVQSHHHCLGYHLFHHHPDSNNNNNKKLARDLTAYTQQNLHLLLVILEDQEVPRH